MATEVPKNVVEKRLGVYQYNAMGQRTTKTHAFTGEVTSYTYDMKGNLLTAGIAGGVQVDYAVDGINRRVAKWVDGVMTKTYL